MYRFVKVFRIKPEHIDDYKKKHMNAHINDRAQLDGLSEQGFTEMRCFMFGEYSIMYAEGENPPDFRPAVESEGCKKWREETVSWYVSEDGKSRPSIELEKVFDLSEQLGGSFSKY